jgi:hypothetical protein
VGSAVSGHVHRWSQPYLAVDGNRWRECYLCRVTEQVTTTHTADLGEPWRYGLDLLEES